jgi:predicted dehydrogenase
VHSLDHMIEFAGRVHDVRCVTARHIPGPSDDTTTVMLAFESGATGLIFCSVATATNFSFTLYGSKGLAEISKPNLQRLRFVPTSVEAPTGPVTAPPDEVSEHSGFDMLNAELTQFARAIRDGSPYPVPIDEVLHGMSVFDAIVRAGKSGAIESVAEPRRGR